jgi:2-dehydro-3-deoxygluconokinase
MMQARELDLFTFGETMVRLTPPGFERLEETHRLDVRIGGAESNMAVASTILGLRCAWSSRLPNNALGRLTARTIHRFGVDVSAVHWVEEGRMGLYFIETGAAPRTSTVLYDRAHSAASRMEPDELDWSVLDRARHLHLTGITPALGEGPKATAKRAVQEARGRGCTVSLDLNYRARLWSRWEAREALLSLMGDVDLLITTGADAALLFDLSGDPEETARALGKLSGARYIALTLGAEGALLWDRSEYIRAAPFQVQAVDRVGAGDAFDAGLVWGFLRDEPARGLEYGMAMAALKHTIPGDLLIASREEIEALIAEGYRDIHR